MNGKEIPKTSHKKQLAVCIRKYIWIMELFWTFIVALLGLWMLYYQKQETLEMAYNHLNASFEKDLIYRKWVAGHGGVYVPVSEETPPNPNLSHMEERDLTTSSGRRLTLINPAYMTRQVQELGAKEYGLKGHITSLNPIRPENAPDSWETESLKAFESGVKETSSLKLIDGQEYLRMMRPMITEQSCLKCHASQGYKVGDIRGGISVSIPMKALWVISQKQAVKTIIGYSIIWLLGLIGVGLGGRYVQIRITETKQAEQLKFLSDQRYKTLYESSRDAIMILIPEKGMVDGNHAAIELFGCKDVKDFTSQTPASLSPEYQPDDVLSATKAQWMIEKAIKEGNNFFEWIHRRMDGSEFEATVLLTKMVLDDKVLLQATVRDISKQKQAEKKIINLARFPDENPNPVLRIASDYTVLYCNKFGAPILDAWGIEVGQQVPERYHQRIEDVFRTDQKANYEFTYYDRVFNITLSPILAAGYVNMYGLDITERKQAESMLATSKMILQRVIDLLPVRVFWKDLNLRILGCNKIFAEDAGKKTAEDLFGKDDFQTTWKEQAEAYRADDQQVIDSGKSKLDYEERQTTPSGNTIWLKTSKVLLTDVEGNKIGILGTYEDITERKNAEMKLIRLATIAEQAREGIVTTDRNGIIQFANQAWLDMYGYGDKDELIGKHLSIFYGDGQRKDNIVPYNDEVKEEGYSSGRVEHLRKNGTFFPAEMSTTTLKDKSDRAQGLVIFISDVTAREKMEIQLRQSEKMQSVGQLASGIAHEINTPIQYIGDNLHFLQEGFTEILKLFKEYEQIMETVPKEDTLYESVSVVKAIAEEADMNYLVDEVPHAIEQSLQGIINVSQIVRAMKEFSHPDAKGKKAIDINHAIESTSIVTRNQWKNIADFKKDFDPDLPIVSCLPGEFNQVILNLIINAVDAIAEKVNHDAGEMGIITASTRLDGEWAEIRISDTGSGIPENIQPRIMEPFFTTKEVGKGSGQGLSIAYSIIVDKHGGTINFESEVGKGSTFIIRLPIEPDQSVEAV